MGVDSARKDIPVIAPNLIENHIAPQDLVPVVDEQSQQSELLRGELHGLAALSHIVALEVDLHIVEAIPLERRRVGRLRAPQ